MRYPHKELSKGGPRSHAELYALISEAKHTFSTAITASTHTALATEARAGYDIFISTLNALKYYSSADELPIFDEVKFDGSADNATLSIPVLAALGFFRNEVRSVCLTELNFSPRHAFDQAVLAYPNTILWGHSAIERLVIDLIKVFSGEDNFHPLLSNPHVRAYQLCRYSHALLGRELEKIGEPLHAQIFLPTPTAL